MNNEETTTNVAPKPEKKGLSVANSIIIAGLLIAIAIIFVGTNKNTPTKNSEEVTDVSKVTLEDSDHVFGNKNADILLVEYSDIDCPFCRVLHPNIKKILSEYPNEVAWVYRDFPLESLHPEAKTKALASECVAKISGEDAYFTYLSYLFENETTAKDLVSIAKNLGFESGKISTCIENEEAIESVEKDMESGKDLGIQGTPFTILVNRETGEASAIRGAVPYENLKQIVDAELAK